jgi:DNA repair protein RecO (recombination protein O)
MLTKTDAIVLRSMKYRDTSKIVSFYSRQFGKIKGIAKGARRAENKFGSALEPMSYVTLVIYKKEQRDLHLISQCDSIKSYGGIQRELEKMSVGFSILELVDQLAHEEEENAPLFELLEQTLAALDRTTRNALSLQRAFQIRFAALLGYAPSLYFCTACGTSLVDNERLSGVGFQLMHGAVTCTKCTAEGKTKNRIGSTTISAPTLQILRRFLSSRMDTVTSIVYSDRIGNELDDTLRLYLRYHFDQMRDLKSPQMFKSMVQ